MTPPLPEHRRGPPCLPAFHVDPVTPRVEPREDVLPGDRGRVLRSRPPLFFSETLFFWKLVSHGGLDFSIFVSSTI